MSNCGGGRYLAYKLVSPYLMNLLLTGYLGMLGSPTGPTTTAVEYCILGVGALAETVKPLVDSCLSEDLTHNRYVDDHLSLIFSRYSNITFT